ncbi:MAG: hypothetical protein ABIO29_03545 [Sphingomicrobium sp.]
MLLNLAACQQYRLPPAPANSPASVGLFAVADGGAIAGEWRVAGLNGHSLDDPQEITASITARSLQVSSGCINAAWSMRIANGAAALARIPVEGCARSFTPTEEALVTALDSARHAYRRTDNSLMFDGPRGAVVLFTQ